jgi:hypothetical protein
MNEYLQIVMTGFCTGIGVGLANFFNEKHLLKRLDKVNSLITNNKEGKI